MSKAPLIYYVEDDEHIRDLTAYALHQAGMEVRAFHDGDGLVERCALEPPDAVLLDIMLPGDDGLVLLQALHSCTFAACHLGAMAFLQRALPPHGAAIGQSLYYALGTGATQALVFQFSGLLYSEYGQHAFLGE